jgi:hypothetical protein
MLFAVFSHSLEFSLLTLTKGMTVQALTMANIGFVILSSTSICHAQEIFAGSAFLKYHQHSCLIVTFAN